MSILGTAVDGGPGSDLVDIVPAEFRADKSRTGNIGGFIIPDLVFTICWPHDCNQQTGGFPRVRVSQVNKHRHRFQFHLPTKSTYFNLSVFPP